jgi:type I restriction enzyme S subunit
VVKPPLDEQQEIASVIDTIDSKILLHQQKRSALDELFGALLHQLMTGELSVDDLDLSAIPTGEKQFEEVSA